MNREIAVPHRRVEHFLKVLASDGNVDRLIYLTNEAWKLFKIIVELCKETIKDNNVMTDHRTIKVIWSSGILYQ
jgi:hypothetical protein